MSRNTDHQFNTDCTLYLYQQIYLHTHNTRTRILKALLFVSLLYSWPKGWGRWDSLLIKVTRIVPTLCCMSFTYTRLPNNTRWQEGLLSPIYRWGKWGRASLVMEQGLRSQRKGNQHHEPQSWGCLYTLRSYLKCLFLRKARPDLRRLSQSCLGMSHQSSWKLMIPRLLVGLVG